MPTLNASYDGTIFRTRLNTPLTYLSFVDNVGPLAGEVYNPVTGSAETDAYFQATKTVGNSGPYHISVARYYIQFDTSDIQKTPAHATFKIYGLGPYTADGICLRSDWVNAGALESADWYSHNVEDPVVYTNEVESFSTGWNNFTFTSKGLADLAIRDTFQMVCVEADHDYTQTEVTTGNSFKTTLLQKASGYPSFEPYLNYTEPTENKILNTKVVINNGKVTIK